MRTPATLQLRAGGGLGWGEEGGGRLESRSRLRVHTWAAQQRRALAGGCRPRAELKMKLFHFIFL